MKQILVTDRLAEMAEEMRQDNPGDGYPNDYYIRMERLARAQAGVADVLDKAVEEEQSDRCINSLVEAQTMLGGYAELLHELQSVRDREYNEVRLNPILAGE